MADMIISPLEVLSIGKVYSFHDLSQAPTFFLRLKNQMNMILHQNIMIDFELVFLFISVKNLKIFLIIRFIPEDILPVISPGKNMKNIIPWGYPRYSWHISILSMLIFHVKKIEPSPFLFDYHDKFPSKIVLILKREYKIINERLGDDKFH